MQTSEKAESFAPPKSARAAARRGLELRERFNRGGTAIGVARARDLVNNRKFPLETVKRMHSFFMRHAINSKAKGSESAGFWGKDSNPSAGWVAWLLWGGTPAMMWSWNLLRRKGEIAEDAKLPTAARDLMKSDSTTAGRTTSSRDGLCVEPIELATAMLAGRKTLLVHPKQADVAGPSWLMLSDGVALGEFQLGDPKPIDGQALDALAKDTLISERTRKARWPDADTLWVYPVVKVEPFPEPRVYDGYPDGELIVRDITLKRHDRLTATEVAELTLATIECRKVQAGGSVLADDPRAEAAGLLDAIDATVESFIEDARVATKGAHARATLEALPAALSAATVALKHAGVHPAEVDAPVAVVPLLRVLSKALPDAALARPDTAAYLTDAAVAIDAVLELDVGSIENATLLKRGFPAPDPEGGVHGHGLMRSRGRTFNDGRHLHVFAIEGKLVVTQEDGAHEHSLPAKGDRSAKDGRHAHVVRLPDGREVETEIGGEHDHDLMVFTTGFDGSHQHTLKLPGGETITSLTPAQFVEMFPQQSRGQGKPIPTASEVLKS